MQMTSSLFVLPPQRNHPILTLSVVFLFLQLISFGTVPTTALAANPVTVEQTLWKQAAQATAPLGKGDLYAMIVGVSRYLDPKVPSLDLAERDAQAFGEFLQTQNMLYREIHVTFLLNEKATKSEIEKYLYYMVPKAGKDDTVILFLSGHGAFDPMRPKEFLFLPYDSESQYLGTTAVKMSGLEFLNGISAERVLIIADACHAGGFSQMKPKALTPSLEMFIREARNSIGRAIISSAKDGELSWELTDKKNSVFTNNFLEGLKGKADRDHDGLVTLNEAYEYAYNKTKEDTGGRQHPQFEGTIVGAFPLSFVGPKMPDSEMRKRLLDAVASGDLANAEKLISYGADINARDDDNATPLIISARHGHKAIAELLLARGAEIDATDNGRSTSLLGAAENGHLELVSLLVGAGALMDAKDVDGCTPLALAARNGHVKLIEFLLNRGSDDKARTNVGDTALTLACAGGHLKAAELLLDRGADANAADLDGASCLIKACRAGHAEVGKLLLTRGARVETKSGSASERQLLRASILGDVREVKRLFGLGVRPDPEATSGDTALTLAAGLENLELMKLLIQQGADPNSRIQNDTTPLITAANNGRGSVVATLLSMGADVNAADHDGNTALMGASRGGHIDSAKLLLNWKASVEAKNKRVTTALMIAADNGRTDVARLLISRGADVNAKDKDGNTPLMLASHNGHADVVKCLLGKNAEVNASNNEGSTSLLLAVKNGQKAVAKLLLSAGANVNAEDWEGKTALAVAAEKGQVEMVDLIRGR